MIALGTISSGQDKGTCVLPLLTPLDMLTLKRSIPKGKIFFEK